MYLEKFKLADRTALVTGAGQGIGLGLRGGARRGRRPDRHRRSRPRDGRSRLRGLKAKGYAAEVVIMDVTDSARVSEVAAEAYRRGTARSTSWSTMPASRAAKRRRKRSPTSTG